VKLVSGFCLYDDFSIHDHIKPLLAKNVAFVKHLDCDFAGDVRLACYELPLEGHHVYVLEESKAERVIYLEETPQSSV
jgi:hypothetical protein